ncbi:hypothetical protein NHX12_028552 [Muraenolepis orangiensis]|uniref:Uncharacterized protein n=1 Tax=Muraenolepis orangiensis TaxID=630683 RepID=A0A9Q0EDH9_9TELE|nr:hypothetical protein NHX12_028552 [Muraenolepis orangiensis]
MCVTGNRSGISSAGVNAPPLTRVVVRDPSGGEAVVRGALCLSEACWSSAPPSPGLITRQDRLTPGKQPTDPLPLHCSRSVLIRYLFCHLPSGYSNLTMTTLMDPGADDPPLPPPPLPPQPARVCLRLVSFKN